MKYLFFKGKILCIKIESDNKNKSAYDLFYHER